MELFRRSNMFLGQTAEHQEQKNVRQAAPERTVDARRLWTEDMVLRETGSGDRLSYPSYSCSTRKVEWISRELDENGEPVSTRIPQETTQGFSLPRGFTAAGKRYKNIQQLAEKWDETRTWCQDIYGREVLCIRELFPCFDSYDYLYEHRYYRWFFLHEGPKLTRVFYADDQAEVFVTEDVANIEGKCWNEMMRLGYLYRTDGKHG